MSPIAFAWRTLTREPLRAALGIAGIAAVGALLFDMLLLSRGLLVSFGDLLASTGFDVRVTATEAMPTLGPRIARASEAAKAIRALPEIDRVVPLRFGRAEVAVADEPARSKDPPHPDGVARSSSTGLERSDRSAREVYVVASEPGAGDAWTLIQGRGLSVSVQSSEELPAAVVSTRLASALRLGPGSRIRLRGGGADFALPPVEFRVTGTAEFPFEAADEATVLTSLAAFAATQPNERADEADLLLVRSRRSAGADAAVAAIRRAVPGLNAFSNEQFLARFGGSDFSYFRQISFVLSSITLFFAFLLVATLLTVSINQRLGEVAALRALGFSRRRVGLNLLAESTLFVGLGGALAFPLGALLARVLDTILRSMPGLPERLHFFVLEPRAVIMQCLLLAAVGLAAAAWPITVATRLPIAATLRKEIIS